MWSENKNTKKAHVVLGKNPNGKCELNPSLYRSKRLVRSMRRQRIFDVRLWLDMISVGVISVAWTGSARAAAAVYPVKVSANNRYLVDQKTRRF